MMAWPRSYSKIQQRYLIEACRIIAQEDELKVTIKESSKAATIAGIGAFAGALLGGPIGVAVGGTIGSVVGALAANNFKSVAEILEDLSSEQKEILISEYLEKVIKNIDIEDVARLVKRIKSRPDLKRALLEELFKFLKEKMEYTAKD